MIVYPEPDDLAVIDAEAGAPVSLLTADVVIVSFNIVSNAELAGEVEAVEPVHVIEHAPNAPFDVS